MLQIRLLGQFDVRSDGKRVMIPTRTAQSLFAFLVLKAGTLHRREKLAGVFWPDTSEENARKNLRQELWRIRKAISALQPVNTDYILTEELTLAFNRDADYWLDVEQLERPDLDLQSLLSNLSLYQAELLPGFYDEWIVLEREHLQAVFDAKMEQLLQQLINAESWTAVQEWAERWLALGYVAEPAYRALMLAYGARGDMAKVAAIYQHCTDELREQLGVEPSAETRALHDGLLKGAKAPSRAGQPSGTVTFLFTDIEGSTRLLDLLRDQYAAVLAEHHEILRAAVQKWNGREVDTQGDAFFVTFARALDAVQCAADAQRTLAAHSWTQGQVVRVRMGLHTGEPLIASTGYVGMDVHRAARIGDAGHGGQVLLSQTTRELATHDLPPGVTIRELGEHRLKDMKYPVPIYQLVIDGLPADFPPLKSEFTGSEAPTPGEAPFKGLQYFDEDDSALFFGRELLTTKLVNRLRESNFLSVVIGASGSGKSSLVRAGLIPALKKANADWTVHILTPTMHPLEALAAELTRGSESVTATATLLDDLARDPRSLHLYLYRQHPSGYYLLVVDQFEELFTLCRDEFEREAFIDNLLTAISPFPAEAEEGRDGGDSPVTLILTLRADFYAHLAQYPELRTAVAQQQEYIGPMTPEELRRAIEEPAKRGHWEFEPGLVDLILRDVGDEPGALPLLSHALLETWKRRAGHTLTLKGYADAGGVRGAIAHTAESAYQNLSPDEQLIARNIFLRLTELGEGTEDTRRRTSLDELLSNPDNAGHVRAVLNTLADARLITLSKDSAEVAHEALIREWPTLREWLNQDREGLRLHRHLTEAAQEWELLDRDAGAVYRGSRLAQAREWAVLHPTVFNPKEQAFLGASIDQEHSEAAERETQRQRELEAAQKLAATEKRRAEEQSQAANRLRMRNRVITAVGAVAILLAVIAGVFSFQSNQNAATAQLNAAQAINAQATAMAESQIRATQQGIAEDNFRSADAQRLAAEANKLLLSAGNSDLIALLSLRSMNTEYSPQGDAALVGTTGLDYPLRVFIGHTDNVDSLAYSPDGKYILTGSWDKTARVWDVQTGQVVHQLIGHTDRVVSVAFSPDGKYILTSGSGDKTARLWDASTGQEVRQFICPERWAWSSAFSPDGKYVITSCGDKTDRLWDTTTGQEVRRFIGQTYSDIVSVAYSPNGKYILTGSADKTARLWDASTGQEVRQFIINSEFAGATFSPDGKYVATISDDEITRLWDTATGKELRQFTGHTNLPRSVAFSPDGKYLLTGSDDNTARLWDVQTGQELRRFTAHIGGVVSVVFSPDGKYILTSGRDNTVQLWDVNSGPELPTFDNTSPVSAIAFSPDGKFALTGGVDGIARLWDAHNGQKLHDLIGHTAGINYGVAFSPDGKYILTGSWDNTARLWDASTGQEVRQFLGHTSGINSVTFSPDGNSILTGSSDWTARLWDVRLGIELRQFLSTSGIARAAFSPDGKYIATVNGEGDSIALLWNVATGQPLRRLFTGFTGFMNSVVFSPNGKYILTGSPDKIARLWDVQTDKEVRQFSGHTDVIWTAVFSPDGMYVATASADGTARLWDTQTGQELRRFVGHIAGVENVAFSPDGKYILTGSDDGTARLWDVDYHTTMQYLCSRLLRDFTDEERLQYNITDHVPTCPRP